MRRKRTRGRWVLVGLFAATALLVGLTLRGLRGSSEVAAPTPTSASVPGASTWSPGAGAATSVERAGDPAHAAPGAAAGSPPGTVPVSQVDPPALDPSTPLPPPPREPPNPAQHRPPMDNPGGVDGDRPARAAPGVE